MTANTMPTFTFNLIEKVDPLTYDSTFLIVNFEGEVFHTFSEHESEKAFSLWQSYLTEAEIEQLNRHYEHCEALAEYEQEKLSERLYFSYN